MPIPKSLSFSTVTPLVTVKNPVRHLMRSLSAPVHYRKSSPSQPRPKSTPISPTPPPPPSNATSTTTTTKAISSSSSPSPSPSSTSAKTEMESSEPVQQTRRVTVVYTPEFNKHRPPPRYPHPECPQRLDVIVSALKTDRSINDLLDWELPPSVKETDPQGKQRRELVMEAVQLVHEYPDYLHRMKDICKRGGGGLDADTYLSPDSYEIALLAVSAWIRAVDIAMSCKTEGGGGKAAWALARPPGHHATPATGMGFCLLSNAAIAAKYALEKKCASKIAILDFDVHHGNGTEASVSDDERILFASSHQWPLYPNSGPEGITGTYSNILNINLEHGTGIDGYQGRFENEMLPFLLTQGKPDLFIVSAGFDALDVDPLAQLDFKSNDYRLFTQLVLEAIGDDTPIIFGLEGGYNLGENGLSAAVKECISGYCLPQ